MNAYLSEICEQPRVLHEIANRVPSEAETTLGDLRADVLAGRFDRIILTGMGTSFFSTYPPCLALSASFSVPIIALDCSELVGAASDVITERSLLIVISQSGESSEVMELANARTRAAAVLSISNMAANTLAEWSDIAFFSRAGAETAVSTKSYTAGLAVLYVMSSVLAARSTQEVRREILGCADAVGQYLASYTDSFDDAHWPTPDAGLAFIGAGVRYASARTGALVTQEAAKLPAMAFTTGQFKHGPVELIPRGLTAIVFAGEAIEELQVSERIAANGGKAYVIGPLTKAMCSRSSVVPTPRVVAGLTPIIDALPVQLIQIPFCNQQGIEPGAFQLATKVT